MPGCGCGQTTGKWSTGQGRAGETITTESHTLKQVCYFRLKFPVFIRDKLAISFWWSVNGCSFLHCAPALRQLRLKKSSFQRHLVIHGKAVFVFRIRYQSCGTRTRISVSGRAEAFVPSTVLTKKSSSFSVSWSFARKQSLFIAWNASRAVEPEPSWLQLQHFNFVISAPAPIIQKYLCSGLHSPGENRAFGLFASFWIFSMSSHGCVMLRSLNVAVRKFRQDAFFARPSPLLVRHHCSSVITVNSCSTNFFQDFLASRSDFWLIFLYLCRWILFVFARMHYGQRNNVTLGMLFYIPPAYVGSNVWKYLHWQAMTKFYLCSVNCGRPNS